MNEQDHGVESLKTLEQRLRNLGWRVDAVPGTLCVSRPGWDEHAGQELMMASGIGEVRGEVRGEIRREERTYYAVVQEHRDAESKLQKYSITLLDRNKRGLHAWHLDTKRGQHQHEYLAGVKIPEHVPHEGSMEQIAEAMDWLMRNGA